jgi:hypothetical protein
VNYWLHSSSFAFPADLSLEVQGPEEAKNRAGEECSA